MKVVGKIYLIILVCCCVGVSGKLIDNLHWDYCKKPQIKNSPVEITELEVDPFPFLKGHEIHFNMTAIFSREGVHVQKAQIEMVAMGMVVYQDSREVDIVKLESGNEGHYSFKYQFEDYFHPGNYKAKIKLLGEDEKNILRCLEFKTSFVDLDDLDIDL